MVNGAKFHPRQLSSFCGTPFEAEQQEEDNDDRDEHVDQEEQEEEDDFTNWTFSIFTGRQR